VVHRGGRYEEGRQEFRRAQDDRQREEARRERHQVHEEARREREDAQRERRQAREEARRQPRGGTAVHDNYSIHLDGPRSGITVQFGGQFY